MKPIYIFILLCCTIGRAAYAQMPGTAITASGTLLDKNKKPLPGVTVLVQERTTGFTSDEQGRFEFECTSNDIIIFKKEGYNTLRKPSSSLDGSSIVMEAALVDAGDDDDVNIPFGVRKKRMLSASISSVKGRDLPQIPLSTLNNVLTGRVPGLYVQQTGTRPGTDDATFLIRGRSSYNSGQAPLVLVDGVTRDFINMDIGEIESISVLKDAASLSWYGMNGGNGVIYVTTKRGSPSATRISLDVQGGVQAPVRDKMTQPLDAYNYALQYNRALQNDGSAPRYDQTALDAYRNGTDPYMYPDVNYTDMFLKNAAPVQRYTATVSGGNAFVRYFSLLSLYNQSGLYNGADNDKYNANTNYRRYNFRTNLDIHLNKTLDVTLDVGGRVENLRYPFAGNGSFMTAILGTPANAFPVKNENGTYGGSSLFRNNPLAMLNENGNITDLYRMLLATLSVRQKLDGITPGLSANVFYTYDITGMYQSGYNQSYEVYEPNSSGGYTRYGNAQPLRYLDANYTSTIRNNEFWGGLDYDRTFGEHDVHFSTRLQTAVSASPGRLDNTRITYANRLSYHFKQRYFADLVGTYAGSQNFAPDKRFGWFPAISAGWIISDEPFLSSLKVLDLLKLRGSYGLAGNDGISTRRFAYNNYFNRGGDQYFFGTGYSNVPNSTEVPIGNPDLTWEKVIKASAGFDAKLLQQSLSVSFDYFYEKRRDLLTSALLPQIIGQEVVDVNNGTAQFKGVEAAVTYHKKIGQFNINLHGNFTYSKSKILALNEEAGLPDYQKRVGHNIGSIAPDNIRTFLIADGIFQTQQEIDAAPVQRFSGVVRPGDIRYRDINGDGEIDNFDFVMTDYSDIPKAWYGFGADVQYKQFYLSALFQGVSGRSIQINSIVNSGSAATGFINEFSADSWSADKATSALWPRMTIANRGNNTVNSTFWLRSGDYLRLKTLEVGYDLPAELMKKWKMNGCRFYVQGYNLFTFSQVNDLPVDPEMPMAGYGSNYPVLRTFTAGMSFNF